MPLRITTNTPTTLSYSHFCQKKFLSDSARFAYLNYSILSRISISRSDLIK